MCFAQVFHTYCHLLSIWELLSADHSRMFLLLVTGFGRLWSRMCVTYCLQTGQLHMLESYYRVHWMSQPSKSVALF